MRRVFWGQMMSLATLLELMLIRCWSLVQFLWYVWLHLYFHVVFSCVVCKYLSVYVYIYICLYVWCVLLTNFDGTLLCCMHCFAIYSLCPVRGWNDDCCCWWSMFVAILPVLLVIDLSSHTAGVGGSGAVVVFFVEICCPISPKLKSKSKIPVGHQEAFSPGFCCGDSVDQLRICDQVQGGLLRSLEMQF